MTTAWHVDPEYSKIKGGLHYLVIDGVENAPKILAHDPDYYGFVSKLFNIHYRQNLTLTPCTGENEPMGPSKRKYQKVFCTPDQNGSGGNIGYR